MAGLATKTTVVRKQKKHGKKNFVRVSNKKAAKNGRQQPKPKKEVKKVKKAKPISVDKQDKVAEKFVEETFEDDYPFQESVEEFDGIASEDETLEFEDEQ